MSWVPRLEFPCEIFLPSLSQFRHDSRVLCRQPIIELIKRLDRCQHLFRNLDTSLAMERLYVLARRNTIIRISRTRHTSHVPRTFL